MASLQDVPDLIKANRLSFAKVEATWDKLTSITNRSQSSGDSPDLENLSQWFSRILNSMDIMCDTMKLSEGSDWEDRLNNLDKGLLELSLVCHHIEGSEKVSFDSLMSRKAIAICHYVAIVNHFRFFLFISGIALEKFKDIESGGGIISRLIDRISCLSKKWNLFNTDSCKDDVLDLWRDNVEGKKWTEDAMKLLYQWILSPLSRATGPLMHREIEMRCNRVGDLNALACCAKWGEELCELLETLDKYFESSETVEFLYEPYCEWHCYTAERLLDLGFFERARKLLDRVQSKLDYMAYDRMVPKWGSNELIKFHTVNPPMKIRQRGRVCRGLYCATQKTSYILKDYVKIENEAEEAWESDPEKWSDEVLKLPVFYRQLNDFIDLIFLERYSEAEQKFKQLDRETCTSPWGPWRLRPLLELLQAEFTPWESFCQMQNLLLNVSEYLGDRKLTARFLFKYGTFIGIRCLSRVPKQHRWRPKAYGIPVFGEIFKAGEVSSLELWFKEELNLQFPSPGPAHVQEVISCLRDPCDVDEHKRELPAMLKACRLLKRSCDIYSDLIHNRTQEFTSDTEWLQFLESQRDSHDTLKAYLLTLSQFCREFWMENGFRESAFETAVAFMDSSLVWVERGRTRSLLSQLGPWYSKIKHGDANHSLKDELIRFDMDEQAAITDIMASCRMAYNSRKKPLFVEYVSLGNMYVAFTIEVKGDNEVSGNCDEIYEYTTGGVEAPWRFHSEKLRTVAGEELADKDLKNLPDEDLEKLADPESLNKLLYLFYEIVPRQQKSNKKCIVAKLHSILEKLYDFLIRPIWERCSYRLWDPNTPVIFVPDNRLYKVPFSLLRDKETKKYLFELHTISIAPSLRVLKHCARRRADLQKFPLKQECILAVGNPAYAEAKDLIPGTGRELMHLRECFQGRLKSLEGHEATRANFLELVKEASFSEDGHVFAAMHLGVHGHWSENMSHKTGSLQFAPPQAADICTEHLQSGQSHTSRLAQESSIDTIQACDGCIRHRSTFGEVGAITRTNSSASDSAMLSSEDIIGSGFEWRTHLAVLSACNSSRGQNHYDCEVNLPRALMIAGVPAAVVSQWKIDDDASPVLMKALYTRLRNGEGVASALQSAMNHVRECTYCCSRPDSEQNIFQWGSFVVWGLPSVALPVELDNDKVHRFDHRKLDTLLASAGRICSVDIDDAILASERILARPGLVEASVFSKITKVYTLVPLEDISRVELFLETNDRMKQLYFFRMHLMFAHAMEGSVQKALECIEWMIPFALRNGNLYDGPAMQSARQERAVIWRIMDEYDKALEEFNALLAFGEDYECLIQIMSYLKHLMGDISGALEHACRAKRLNHPGLEHTRFISVSTRSLGLCALPDEYHRWLKDVDEPSAPILDK